MFVAAVLSGFQTWISLALIDTYSLYSQPSSAAAAHPDCILVNTASLNRVYQVESIGRFQLFHLFQIFIKPGDSAAHNVPQVLGVHEHVAFALVDDQLRLYSKSF